MPDDDRGLTRLLEEVEELKKRMRMILELPFLEITPRGTIKVKQGGFEEGKVLLALRELSEIEEALAKKLKEFAYRYPFEHAEMSKMLTEVGKGVRMFCPKCCRISWTRPTCPFCDFAVVAS
jgi:hypothetical protein